MNHRRIAWGLVIWMVLPVLSVNAQPDQEERERIFMQFLEAKLEADQTARSDFLTRYNHPEVLFLDDRPVFLHRVENGRPHFRGALDEVSAQGFGADELWPGGNAAIEVPISGAGQTVGIWESFGLPLTTHEAFGNGAGGSRITYKGAHHPDTSIPGGHATHVTGLAAAGGMGSNPFLKSMPYESAIDAYDSFQDYTEMTAAATAGLKVSNHAYGNLNGWRSSQDFGGGLLPVWWGDPSISSTEDFQFGFYNASARDWDVLAATFPEYNIVIAAGNDRVMEGHPPGTEHWVFTGSGPFSGWEKSTATRDDDCSTDSGYDCIIGGIQTAKNVITVGGVENFAGTGCPLAPDNPLSMTNFSGWGPTDDGRIKPDLVAPGYKARAPREGSNTVWACGGGGGTSWAAPHITGALALLFEHQENLSPGQRLRAATYKALLIHTAMDLGNTGPDYEFGWGIPNIQDAAELMQRNDDKGTDLNIHEETLLNAGTYTLQVVSDGSPLKATIAWTDPAGTPVAPSLDPTTRMLVNDLDLRITGTGSMLPWILNPATPSVAATHGDNDRDNVEQVLINTPTFGEVYTITVDHKNSLSGSSQNFSLIVDGILAALPADMVTVDLKVLMQGPYNDQTQEMETALNNNGTGPLPVMQPYDDATFSGTPLFYNGTETVPAGFFASHPDIVDWVQVQLRATSNGPTLASRAALIDKDGNVVDLDGTSPVKFFCVSPGNYYVVVRFRNHLDLMTASALSLTASAVGSKMAATAYDFTTSAAQAFGGDQQGLGGGKFGAYAGDSNADGKLTYIGAERDQLSIISELGTGNLADISTGYLTSDMDMDGEVIYIGADRDQRLLIANLGTGNLAGQILSNVPPN